MACHIPGCQSEMFINRQDYMNLHWYKVHKQTYRMYVCPLCEYKTNVMDEVKRHIRIAHKVKKKGEIKSKCCDTEDILEEKLQMSSTANDTEIVNKKIKEMIDRYIPVGYRYFANTSRKQINKENEMHQGISLHNHMLEAESQSYSLSENFTCKTESKVSVHSIENSSDNKGGRVTYKIEPQSTEYNTEKPSEITVNGVTCKIEPQSPEYNTEKPSEITVNGVTCKIEPQSPEYNTEKPSEITVNGVTCKIEPQSPEYNTENPFEITVNGVTCKIEPQSPEYNTEKPSEITVNGVTCKIEPQSPEYNTENPSEITVNGVTCKIEPQSPEYNTENPSEVTVNIVTCKIEPKSPKFIDGKPDPGTQFSIDIAMGRKRKITEGDESDEESNDMTAPPIHDIYRSRQQKRTK
ncbi:hypothetical protein KUTeg_006726 [Tegillarca granosa]|uniref:C2H2-type domain-containing protein n=1 Tax=Tegillarca granosa TaxID=220873 RepID=A0ABQ9FED0_TEGGR|nr:hypothetical protein KUTeg_006726 [Tegillarca granosa]